jgi:hypothetical protein
VDCGAVRGGLQDHPFLFLPLVVATIPAMYVGMVAVGVLTLISGPADHPAGYFAGAFVAQFLIYFVLGLVLSKIVRLMRGKNNHPAQHKMTLQPIMDILDARAGGVIPGHVVPEIRCLLEYLNGHGVVWSGFNHSKDDLEQGVVDEVYLRNVTGKSSDDALLVSLMKNEKDAEEWLAPPEDPEAEKECEIAVNGRLVVQIQFTGPEADRIKRLVADYSS